MSSSEIVVATTTRDQHVEPEVVGPPLSAVNAATTRPVIRLISGSAASSRTRSGSAESCGREPRRDRRG